MMLNEIINYGDIPYNYFNNWLSECLLYNQRIVFDEDDLTEDYLELLNVNDVIIKFTEDYQVEDDDFDIAVWCKIKDDNEWHYLDNITRDLYERRLGK